jgi:HD domain/GAF domain
VFEAVGTASIHQERREAPDQEIRELVDALRAAGEPRAAAVALAGCLRRMLAADAVSVHACRPALPPALVATAGTPAPPLAARAAQAAAGGAPAGGFSVRGPSPPDWLLLVDRAQPAGAPELRLIQEGLALAAVGIGALERAARARTRAHTGRALVELGQTLGMASSQDGILHLLCLAVCRLVDQSGCAVWAVDGDRLRLAAAAGYPVRNRPQPGHEIHRGDLLAALAGSKRIRTVAIAEAPHAAPPPRARTVVVPIGERAATRALVCLERDTEPSAPEEALLIGIADQALLAIENQRLLAERDRTLDDLLVCLARALEVRHHRTAEHSDRLIEDCREVAQRMGVSGAALTDVLRAAALHDLGKIGVPERILDGVGPLDDEGWQAIRRHPDTGARIIEPVQGLRGVAELVRCCHEHWDGGGYPRGLRGDEIPLGARIILACDAYHAMTEDRSYQAAMTGEEARGRLRDLAGEHFDPKVIGVYLDVLADSGLTKRSPVS